MNKRNIPRWLGLLGALGLVGVALAQVSSNFDVHWSLLSSGGGSRRSVNYQLDDALGQAAAGVASSATYQVQSGFMQVGRPALAISPQDVTLKQGQTQVFNASGGTGTFSWVASGGTLTPTSGSPVTYTAGTQNGDFNVLVTSGSATAAAAVHIRGLNIVALDSTHINVGATCRVSITNPSENVAPFSWFSTNPSVGTILPIEGGTKGQLTGVAPGITSVYARDNVGVESNRVEVIVGNTLDIPHVYGAAGKPVVAHVNANNAYGDSVSSLQMTVRFNPSLLQAKQAKVTYRTAHFSLGANIDNGLGSVTLLLTSITGEKIAAGTGPILDLVFDVNAGATNGMTSTLALNQVQMVDANGVPIAITPQDGVFEVCPACLIHDGDVNQDGFVTVADLQLAINIYLLKYTPNSEEFAAADVSPAPDGDDLVNVVDVLRIFNMILGKATATQGPSKASPPSLVRFQVPGRISANAGESLVVPVAMSNEALVGGVDMTLVYTGALGYLSGTPTVTNPRGSHMALRTNTDNAGYLQIILHSPDTVQGIPIGSGTVFQVNLGTASQSIDIPLRVDEAAVGDVGGNPMSFGYLEPVKTYLPLVMR
jgi:hypothetical protein